MSLLQSSVSLIKKNGADIGWGLGLSLAGLGLSVVTAYLVVDGAWHLALGLIMALPAAILLQRYPFLGLILWLLLTPFTIDLGGAPRKVYWAIHRLLPLAIIGIILISSILRTHQRKLPRLGWVELAMAGYVMVSVLSIIYLGDDIQATLIHYYDRVIVPMCLYLVVRFLKPNEAELRWLLPALIFVLITQSIIGLISWVVPQVLPSAWLSRVGTRTTGSLGAYSVFTSTVMFCGLFILHAALNQELTKIRRIWYVSLFSLTLFMVFLSFSRGSWLAALIVMCGLAYLYPKFLLRFGAITVPIIAIVVSAGFLGDYLSWAGQRFYSDQSEEAALSRLPIYYASYKMFEAKPLFGWGFGNFDRYDRQFQGRVLDLISPEKDHASHNVYLTLIAEQGIVGFFLFLAPVFWWLLVTFRAWPKIPTHGFMNRNLLFTLWLIILFHFIVNNFSNMRVVFGLGLWWITLGLIANIVCLHLTPEARQSRYVT